MIKITRIETVYPSPIDDEEDYCPDGESSAHDEEVSFRELVELMRYNNASCSHPSGSVFEWITTEPYIDPYTGNVEEKTLHYSRENPSRNAKYWKLAMIASKVIR